MLRCRGGSAFGRAEIQSTHMASAREVEGEEDEVEEVCLRRVKASASHRVLYVSSWVSLDEKMIELCCMSHMKALTVFPLRADPASQKGMQGWQLHVGLGEC